MKPDMLRQERDRFVAFAFASADLLVELDLQQRVLSAHGAIQALTGRSAQEMQGQQFSRLFTEGDRLVATRILGLLPDGGRLEPAKLRVDHRSGAKLHALVGACRMPTIPNRIFASIGLSSADGDDAAGDRDSSTGLLEGDALMGMACNAARDTGGPKPRNLTLMKVDGLAELERRLPKESAKALLAEIGATLRARSLKGDMAARLGNDSFGFVENGMVDQETIANDIGSVAQSMGLQDGALRPMISQIELSGSGLDKKDIEKAVSYAVKRFLKDVEQPFYSNAVKQDLSQIIEGAIERTGQLRRHIDQRELDLVFQPVVAIRSRTIHHYEALVRSPDGRSAFDTITFGENVGLICDLDEMICRKALLRLEEKDSPAVAVNLSGASVQSAAFRDALAKMLTQTKVPKDKIIFELTESSEVENLDEVAAFLRWLRIKGHQVCIDDFGTGAAAYSYLRNFEVDFVKIDGPFLQAATKRSRERALVKSIAMLCRDLGCKTIGEMIETDAQSDLAASLGIEYGQGWLYGKPLPELPRQVAAPLTVQRRQGTRESWG